MFARATQSPWKVNWLFSVEGGEVYSTAVQDVEELVKYHTHHTVRNARASTPHRAF